MPGTFEVYEDAAGRWRFRLTDDTGAVVAFGEPFETKTSAKRACELVQRAAADATVVEI